MTRQNSYICSKHIKDRSIKDFIIENADSGFCKYCNTTKQVVSISDLAKHIEDLVEHEYDDPYSRGALYDKEANYYEDRFPGVAVEQTESLLERELDVDDWQVIEDLSGFFGNSYWSEIDGIWGPTQDEYLIGGWKYFQEILKHKIRFLFFDGALKEDFTDNESESLNPYFILREVHKAVDQLHLYKSFSKGRMRVFRSRQHDKSEEVNSAYKLGSPLPQFAKANRMSPAGISMFYGAFDAETCEMEIEDSTSTKSIITTGKFSNLKDLTVIDFTKLKEIPSLFDEKNRDKRAMAKFLKSFIRDLSVPVKPDDSVHIEYIPTQVVTEYIKVILGREKNVDGIIYNSVKKEGSKCVVLFLENSDICDEYEIKDPIVEEASKFLGLGTHKVDFDIKTIKTMILHNKNLLSRGVGSAEPGD